jgi:hypothetical protein
MVKARYDATRAGKQVACCTPANYCMINPVLGADFKVYSRMEIEWFFKNKRQFNRGVVPENQSLVEDLGTEIYTWWNKTPQQLQHGIETMAKGLKKHDEQLQKNNTLGLRRDTFGRTPFHLNLQYIDENTRLALVGNAMHLVQRGGNALFIGSTMEQAMVMSMSRMDITIELALERVAGTSLANNVLSTLVYSYAGVILISGSLKYVSAYILFKCDTIVGSLRCFIETWRGTPSFSDVAKATTFLRNMMCHGKGTRPKILPSAV